jgi:hypothetical protein
MEIYKVVVYFRRTMSGLLNDGLEGKYVVNGLMSRSKYCLSPSSQRSLIKLLREIHIMDNHGIDIQ